VFVVLRERYGDLHLDRRGMIFGSIARARRLRMYRAKKSATAIEESAKESWRRDWSAGKVGVK